MRLLLHAFNIECEPSIQHWTHIVANFDGKMTREGTTIGCPHFGPQHVGKRVCRLVLHIIQSVKFRAVLVGRQFVPVTQIEIIEGYGSAPYRGGSA